MAVLLTFCSQASAILVLGIGESMTIGPREAAHREHRDALDARALALKRHGRDSEAFRLADARLTQATRNLPEPPSPLE
jgi:hypothetical protein